MDKLKKSLGEKIARSEWEKLRTKKKMKQNKRGRTF